MKLVIDIDRKTYRVFKRDNFLNMGVDELWDAIRKGIPYERYKCNECVMNDGNNCILEGCSCIYLALEHLDQLKRKDRT